jgi:hypothetical protein
VPCPTPSFEVWLEGRFRWKQPLASKVGSTASTVERSDEPSGCSLKAPDSQQSVSTLVQHARANCMRAHHGAEGG